MTVFPNYETNKEYLIYLGKMNLENIPGWSPVHRILCEGVPAPSSTTRTPSVLNQGPAASQRMTNITMVTLARSRSIQLSLSADSSQILDLDFDLDFA